MSKDEVINETIETRNKTQEVEDSPFVLKTEKQTMEDPFKPIMINKNFIYFSLLAMVLICAFLLYCLICQLA